MKELFESLEAFPENVREVIDKYSKEDFTYETCRQLIRELLPLGYTFDWYLDAIPFNLRTL